MRLERGHRWPLGDYLHAKEKIYHNIFSKQQTKSGKEKPKSKIIFLLQAQLSSARVWPREENYRHFWPEKLFAFILFFSHCTAFEFLSSILHLFSVKQCIFKKSRSEGLRRRKKKKCVYPLANSVDDETCVWNKGSWRRKIRGGGKINKPEIVAKTGTDCSARGPLLFEYIGSLEHTKNGHKEHQSELNAYTKIKHASQG